MAFDRYGKMHYPSAPDPLYPAKLLELPLLAAKAPMAGKIETTTPASKRVLKYAVMATTVLLAGCAGLGDNGAPSQPFAFAGTSPIASFSQPVTMRDPLAGVGPSEPAAQNDNGSENFVTATLASMSEFWRRGRRVAWNRWADAHLQEGDIVFLQSEGNLILGVIDFSKLTSEVTASPFTHMGIAAVENGQVVVYDMSLAGAGRKTFGQLMAMPDTAGVAVKRLRHEYRRHIPAALEYCHRVHEHRIDFDRKLRLDNDKLYCTELVELAFRSAGLRLSHPVRWDALPGFRKNSIAINAIRIANGTEPDEYVIIAGNDQIGIWSSPALELVLDLTDVDSAPTILGPTY